jgi:2-amino-4-hydroxy-6-hydroxymethyldihydropteridine diphosphokinase
LGTNLGDRLANLQAAQAALAPQVSILAASPVYETAPWGYRDQPAFLNRVVQAQTGLSPVDLLLHLKHIEVTLGRKPNFRNGPRLIDLDILFYADLVLDTPDLVIPHPRLAERAFVLIPLADLAPGLRHPVFGLTIRELLQSVDQQGVSLYHFPTRLG